MIVNDATLKYEMKFEKAGYAHVPFAKKFSTVDVTVVDQKLLKPSEGGGHPAGAAPAPVAPSAREQADLTDNDRVDEHNPQRGAA